MKITSSGPPLQSGPPQIGPGDVQAQFSVLKLKNGQVVVQFPLLDATKQTIDFPTALELCGAGLQTLARIMRDTLKQEPSLITVVPGMPPGL